MPHLALRAVAVLLVVGASGVCAAPPHPSERLAARTSKAVGGFVAGLHRGLAKAAAQLGVALFAQSPAAPPLAVLDVEGIDVASGVPERRRTFVAFAPLATASGVAPSVDDLRAGHDLWIAYLERAPAGGIPRGHYVFRVSGDGVAPATFHVRNAAGETVATLTGELAFGPSHPAFVRQLTVRSEVGGGVCLADEFTSERGVTQAEVCFDP